MVCLTRRTTGDVTPPDHLLFWCLRYTKFLNHRRTFAWTHRHRHHPRPLLQFCRIDSYIRAAVGFILLLVLRACDCAEFVAETSVEARDTKNPHRVVVLTEQSFPSRYHVIAPQTNNKFLISCRERYFRCEVMNSTYRTHTCDVENLTRLAKWAYYTAMRDSQQLDFPTPGTPDKLTCSSIGWKR